MAIKLEKVVEKFYLGLEEGKILGRKCPACGAVEFPPVYACNTCGNLETEWYEISGKGVMKSIVMPAALSSKPEYDNLGRRNFAYGEVELEEGACFNAVVRGISQLHHNVQFVLDLRNQTHHQHRGAAQVFSDTGVKRQSLNVLVVRHGNQFQDLCFQFASVHNLILSLYNYII